MGIATLSARLQLGRPSMVAGSELGWSIVIRLTRFRVGEDFATREVVFGFEKIL